MPGRRRGNRSMRANAYRRVNNGLRARSWDSEYEELSNLANRHRDTSLRNRDTVIMFVPNRKA
jgi:hypothetical protein